MGVSIRPAGKVGPTVRYTGKYDVVVTDIRRLADRLPNREVEVLFDDELAAYHFYRAVRSGLAYRSARYEGLRVRKDGRAVLVSTN